MKKIILAILLPMVFLFSACSVNFEAEDIIEKFDNFAANLGESQITQDKDLIGKREYAEDDHYTGEYVAECENADGREVIFGGASVKDRKIKLSIKSKTDSGSFKIRVGRNWDVKEYAVDEKGGIEKELEFSSGGNYIMIDYEDFKGRVELSAKYI